MIKFQKYQGAGNDFIMIDNRASVFKGDKVAFAKKWCSRRFGIGSDGIIFLEEDSESDFLMDFYNPDGSQSFCGNGSRCIVAFAQSLGLIDNKATFKAIDGIHEGSITRLGVKIKMGDVNSVEEINEDHFIDTGSPHYISYESESLRDIVVFGKEIRYSDKYSQEGVNVNLIEDKGLNHIAIRTYERGVENETLACGTGATACGLSYALVNGLERGVIDVDAKGGKLKIHLVRDGQSFSEIYLEGPAEFVYGGEIND